MNETATNTTETGGQVHPMVIRFRNARKAIDQIRAGEWIPNWNSLDNSHLTAHRGKLELWLGNGALFCEIRNGEGDYFGFLWRHWVWWAAARKLKHDADRQRVAVL